MTRKAFTLIEILVAIAILGLLCAILLPVFSRVRAKSYQASCVSNLHQLGTGIALYQQDYDGLFPYGGDPTDTQTHAWDATSGSEVGNEARNLHPLPIVLHLYIKNPEIWRCPADSGFDYEDLANRPLKARPSSFEAFGTSYYYRTALTLKRKKDLLGWESWPPYVEHGPEAINVLFDGSGAWHAGNDKDPRHYNVLWGDGHIKNVGRVAFLEAWHLELDKPSDSSSTVGTGKTH